MNKIKNDKLPDFLKIFFWDIDPEELEIKQDYFIILERLLNYGDDKALKWVLQQYNYNQIIDVVKRSIRLTPKTANFWHNLLGLKEEEVRCMQKPYQKMEKKFWNY